MESYEMFQPLSQKEQASLRGSIIRLFSNPDFQLLVRDLFNKANPLHPSFSVSTKNDPIAAAKSEGEKIVSKYLLDIYLKQGVPEKKKQKTQEVPELDISQF